MVQMDVPPENAEGLTQALHKLDSGGLHVVVAQSGHLPVPAAMQAFDLALVGDDRVGIVSGLTRMLARRGVSIENLHTEIVGGGSGKQTFKIGAHLLLRGRPRRNGCSRCFSPLWSISCIRASSRPNSPGGKPSRANQLR